MHDLFTHDIKLASILIALGIPSRKSDPVTSTVEFVEGHRKEQFVFWFGVDDAQKSQATEFISAYNACRNWEEYKLPCEHPLYYMKGCLENREVLLNWIRKNVAPMKIIKNGSQTILIGEKASQKTKDKLQKFIQ